jgi:hypothetical protein
MDCATPKSMPMAGPVGGAAGQVSSSVSTLTCQWAPSQETVACFGRPTTGREFR